MSLTIDGVPVHVDPLVAAMIVALLDQQRTITRQMYGTVLINFAPKTAKVTVWRKVAEDGA